MSIAKKLNIALIGSPNSGKTTLFNQLTGLNQHVGNYDGVTIDKKTGTMTYQNREAKLIDLPGTYSLYPIAEDERVVLNSLLNKKGSDYPDIILFVANAANLKKGMLLLSQLMDLNIPLVFCLNMKDLAEKRGYDIDIIGLQEKLQIPVLYTNAKKGDGIDALRKVIFDNTRKIGSPFRMSPSRIPTWIQEAKKVTGLTNDYATTLALCDYQRSALFDNAKRQEIESLIQEKQFNKIVTEVEDKKARLSDINALLTSVVTKDSKSNITISDKIDMVLTHNVYGTLILVIVLFLIFQGVFSLAKYPMDQIDLGFGAITAYLKGVLPDTWWQRLLTDGILTGIGGIVIFIPQIAVLFGLVALLEESGYMPRAVYLSDKLMSKFGLNGRSLVSFISGVACAVPAIMSARSISNKKERLITIFVTPFISCSARLPVYVTLAAFVVPEESVLGIFNLQGLVLFSLYFLGFFAALTTSYLLHKYFKTEDKSYLTLELPAYQVPSYKNVVVTLIDKTKIFVFNAGKIILIISIVLWFLVSYGPGDKMQQLEEQALTTITTENHDVVMRDLAAQKLEHSYAGRLGKVMEPAIRPLGFDWKIGIALITSFAAREVFVSTMATIYSSASDDVKTIQQRMREQVDFVTGEKTYTRARSFSLLIFYVFAMQCMSTIAIVRRETNSWAIAIAQLLFMTGVAYVASYVAFNYLF